MRKLLWLLLLVSPLTFGFTLTWDEPAVPTCDLAGFEVYQSSVSGAYTSPPIADIPAASACGNITGITYTGTNPNSGTVYWVVKAYDSSHNLSAPSNEATKTFFDVTPPAAPSNLQVK
jgi:hypothetical protein